MSRLFASLLLVGCIASTACAPKVTPVAELSGELQGQSPEPVYFKYGKADLAKKADEEQIARVAAALKADDRQYVFLAGYADPTGDPGANLALSQARAEVVRELLVAAAGVSEDRVIARGLGHLDKSGSGNATLRRVDFIFVQRGMAKPKGSDRIVASLVEAGLIDPTAQAVAPKASAGKDGGGGQGGNGAAPVEGENIVKTGLSDVDAVFAQVQGLLDLVRGARTDIATAELSLRSALGVTEGADLGDALKELKTEAKGSIQLKMNGARPSLSTRSGASPKVTKAVAGINGLVAALARATQKLAQVPKQAQAVIAQAKTVPSTLPNSLKEAGMAPKELPGMLRAVKKNIKLTASVPKECAQVGKDAASTFKMVASTFAG